MARDRVVEHVRVGLVAERRAAGRGGRPPTAGRRATRAATGRRRPPRAATRPTAPRTARASTSVGASVSDSRSSHRSVSARARLGLRDPRRLAARAPRARARSPRGGRTRRGRAPGRPPRRPWAASRRGHLAAPARGAGSRARRGSAPTTSSPEPADVRGVRAAAPGRGGSRARTAPPTAGACSPTNTLSSARPWISSSGGGSARRRARAATSRSYASACSSGVPEVPLRVGGVVQPLVGDRARRRPPRGTRRVARSTANAASPPPKDQPRIATRSRSRNGQRVRRRLQPVDLVVERQREVAVRSRAPTRCRARASRGRRS